MKPEMSIEKRMVGLVYQRLQFETLGWDFQPPWWVETYKDRVKRCHRLVRRLVSGAYFPPASGGKQSPWFAAMSREEWEDEFLRWYWATSLGVSRPGVLEGHRLSFLAALSRPGWLCSLTWKEPMEAVDLSGWALTAWTRWQTEAVSSPGFIGQCLAHRRFWDAFKRSPYPPSVAVLWSGSQAWIKADQLSELWNLEAQVGVWAQRTGKSEGLKVEFQKWSQGTDASSLALGNYRICWDHGSNPNRPGAGQWVIDLEPGRLKALICDIRHWPYRRWLGMDLHTFLQVLAPRIAYLHHRYAAQHPRSWAKLRAAVDRKILQWVRAKYRGKSTMSRPKAHLLMGNLNLQGMLDRSLRTAESALCRKGVLSGPFARNRQNKKSRISGDA